MKLYANNHPTAHTQKISRFIIVMVFASVSLSGCVTALVAGAAIATIDIIHDRRSAGEYVDDSTIELTAQNYLISDPALRSGAHVKPVSWNGILLITGEIDSEQTKQQVIANLSNIDGVRQLVDETTIIGKSALLSRTNDTWITTKVKSRLLLKTGLDANRVKVITVRGSVYLMGIVTESEARRATNLARGVKGVARVVKVFEYTDEIADQ
ncbi:MAG: BON domain-containing protein [Gammaproteobacteria bacterium]|nr:BON domain-containing protein [Gammaproteobacteria bacterium]